MDNGLSGNVIEDIVVSKLQNSSKTGFRRIYEINRNALLSYKFWRSPKVLPPFFDVGIIPVCLGASKYAYFDRKNKLLSKPLVIRRTKRIERAFFYDLEKPLLIQNEMNTFHWEYLNDRVRESVDFGADNHVYMYYENINDFLLLLMVADIVPYLKEEKFIFLLGRDDKKHNYPLDLRRMYNIEYFGSVKNIRLDEIKALVVNWISPGLSGNAFLCGVMDMHKNLLTAPRFALSTHMFAYIYLNVLQGECVEKAITKLLHCEDKLIKKEFDAMFNSKQYYIDFFKIMAQLFEASYVPTKVEWVKAFYLAYAMAIGRKFQSRISPMIKIETHSVACPSQPVGEVYDVFASFKYFYGVSIIRRPSIALASCCDMFRARNDAKNYLKEINNRLSYLLENHDPRDCRWYSPCYLDRNDKFLIKRVMIRFEDLKLYPKASLLALCEYLDIEWDDSLLYTTANGVPFTYALRGKGSEVSDYDKTPVYNLHETVMSRFDHYRFEMLFGNKFSPWGYEPLFYNDDMNFTEEEIIKLFEIRFKFEKFHSERAKEENLTIRNELYNLVKRLISLDYAKENMVPIPWLKPKMEFVDGELYH